MQELTEAVALLAQFCYVAFGPSVLQAAGLGIALFVGLSLAATIRDRIQV